MECAGKVGFPGFGFSQQGDNSVLRGRRRLPEEEMRPALPPLKINSSKLPTGYTIIVGQDGKPEILDMIFGAHAVKMEILGQRQLSAAWRSST